MGWLLSKNASGDLSTSAIIDLLCSPLYCTF